MCSCVWVSVCVGVSVCVWAGVSRVDLDHCTPPPLSELAPLYAFMYMICGEVFVCVNGGVWVATHA